METTVGERTKSDMPDVDISRSIPIPRQRSRGTQNVPHEDTVTDSDDELNRERPDKDLSEDINEIDAVYHDPHLRRSTRQTSWNPPARPGFNSACVATDSKRTLQNTCILLRFRQAKESAVRTKWLDAMGVEFDTPNDFKA